jgi:type I restriction enzyme S subunit
MLSSGDLLIEKSGGGDQQPVGRLVKFDHYVDAVCSNFLAHIVPKNGYNSNYLVYLHATLYTIGLNVRSIKQTTGIQNLDSRMYFGETVAFPPLPEQAAIARFLDYMDQRIRRVIRARQRRIKLLEEYKQALIHQAVTGQIDVRTGQPYPAYKDSGVEWLGQVPAHWEVRRLGSVTQILNGATPSTSKSEYWDGSIVWITPDDLGKLKSRYIDNSSRAITSEGYTACGTTLAPAGSIAMSTRAPIGHLGILRVAACVNQGCRLLVPQPTTVTEYLYYSLVVGRPNLEVLGQGSTFMELSRAKLGAFSIPCPPLPEQTAIVEYLDAQTANIDAAIEASGREIDLLREYRTRLISDVVTGKVDVREVAAQLPEEPPEEAELEGTEETAESEAADDDDAVAETFSEEEVEP